MDNQRVMTLHPDEHVAIIIDRIGNVMCQLETTQHIGKHEELEFIVDELESLRSYLRSQRGL